LTLVELMVVIAIMLVLIALGAAFVPRVSQSQQLSTAIDSLEQWLLSAKVRAKRDGLPTGLRFIPDPNNPGMYSQFVYIQQPDPLVGGTPLGNGQFKGGYLGWITSTATGTTATFGGVDFTGGQSNILYNLVQPYDYLELRDSGVYLIGATTGGNQLHLGSTVQTPYYNVASSGPPVLYRSAYEVSLTYNDPTIPTHIYSYTGNYRILRQPRPILGENPLQLPGNMLVDVTSQDPGLPNNKPPIPPQLYTNVLASVSGNYDILFSPSGSVIDVNSGLGNLYIFVHDLSLVPNDPNDPDPLGTLGRTGLVGVQTRTGFIGAYSVGPAGTPYLYANQGRASGL
jgi:type II secretory pathway pseudopilin PulG